MLPSQSRPLLSHLIAQETSSFHTFSYDEMLCFLHLVNAEKRFEVYTGRSQQDRRIATTQIPPRVLIVAGSDSGGGAGIQADIKACTNVGVFSMTAITAVTVQNSLGVHGIHAIPVATIGDQMTCVLDDLGADVVKIGMLFNEEIIEKVVQVLETRHLPLVLDPVMVATSGHRLLKKAAHTCMVSKLFPLATIITPNALEASALLDDCSIQTLNDMKQAAKKLHPLGPKYVLVKGGHLPCTPDGILRDVLYDGKEFHIIESRFLSTRNTHGTGCTLAAAIAAYYAKSKDMILAVHQAVEYLHGILLRSQDLQLGQGSNGPMLHVKYK
jgi:hydroxymethylpyrimidine kinase/phosphomethylpyrimidine kinase